MNEADAPPSEKAFHEVKRRELRRFHGAVESVVEGLLLKKYEENRKAEEYRDYARVCGSIKSMLNALDLMADNMAPLFETADGRANWEVYLSGLRYATRKMPDSYLFRFVLPMFGLDELREKLSAYATRSLEQMHSTQRVLREAESYIKNLHRGYAIANEYDSKDGELPRLYASVKTWSSKDDMDRFASELAEFLNLGVEVFVVGPVQMYLMLGRDAFTLIFKALSISKLTEVREKGREYDDVMRLHDFVHGLVDHSTTVQVTQEILKQTVKEYVKRLNDEQIRLRGQLPTKEMKYRFTERFESGALFRMKEE